METIELDRSNYHCLVCSSDIVQEVLAITEHIFISAHHLRNVPQVKLRCMHCGYDWVTPSQYEHNFKQLQDLLNS